MERRPVRAAVLAAVFCLARVSGVNAAIIASGDVTPANPATWTTSTTGYIGNTSTGSVTVDANSDLKSKSGYIGYLAGSTGAATVDDVGSTWTNSLDLSVGMYGQGTLNVTGGGAVSNSTGYVGTNSGSTGAVLADSSLDVPTRSEGIT